MGTSCELAEMQHRSCMGQTQKMGGASWILRNNQGTVLMHSRRAFFNSLNFNVARHAAFLWATESMSSHRVNRVIMAVEDTTTMEMIQRPRAWPSFKRQIHEMMSRLAGIEWWRVTVEQRPTNRGAFLIAQSVTKELRTQSYVASCLLDGYFHCWRVRKCCPLSERLLVLSVDCKMVVGV
ncbi:hypothetical protein N665_0288s0014 [Sinapis alba]|nr:hypothetical protein N665_0288s0014 [Sinapis alba]